MGCLRDGDVAPTKSLKVVIQDGAGWATYAAPKGKQFVVLLLGVEDTKPDGQRLDPEAALNALGWFRRAT